MNQLVLKTVLPLALACLSACGSEDGKTAPADTGQTLTYWDDMVPVFAKHCMPCHQDGGIAPFRLDEYAAAQARAASIRVATEQRTMPPWGATSDGSCGTFVGSLALSDDDIAKIGQWVEGGAKEGKPARIDIPSQPTLENARSFETPDFLPEVAGGELAAHDEYRCFMLEPGVTEQAFITGYDVVPGTPEIVHHVLLMVVDPNAPADDPSFATNLERMQALDAESPDRDGWPCFNTAGEGVAVKSVPVVWAPGQGVVEYPNKSGVPLAPTDKVVVQVHYNLAEVHGKRDQTAVKLRIVPEVENVGLFLLLDPLLDTLFEPTPASLEPGKASVKYTWKQSMAELGLAGVPSVSLYGVMPHMHQLGRKYRMTVGDGASEPQCGADVQDWDFHWQRLYFYESPIALTDSSSIEVTCDYDTSSRKTPVVPGWGTENEMCLATLYVTVPLSVFAEQ